MPIEPGNRVAVRSVVHDAQGCCLDSGTMPFEFTMSKGETIPGIEHAVQGRQAGDRLQFTCAPEDAYGLHRPELVFEAVHANLPPNLELKPGAMLSPGGGEGRFHLKVLELTENGARLDGNHPLAGQTLHFDLEIISVSAP